MNQTENLDNRVTFIKPEWRQTVDPARVQIPVVGSETRNHRLFIINGGGGGYIGYIGTEQSYRSNTRARRVY